MKNPSENKLEKLVFGMFDQMVEGADKYVTKQGSTWLIFTEDKRWVIEFTNDKTLWFNYNLFQSELELIGKDCTEEKDLIKNWFESRFLGIKPVEDTIQNGVKRTQYLPLCIAESVEDTIQNGVKHTEDMVHISKETVEDTIQNGVKETQTRMWPPVGAVDETIQNGVKETTPSGYLGSIEMKGKIVHQFESPKQNNEVEDTIQNGVKNTHPRENELEWVVEDTIENGVKSTHAQFLPPQSYVEDAIQNGVRMTKSTIISQDSKVEDTIKNGVKETKSMCGKRGVRVDYIIQNGVKDTRSYSDRDKKTVGDIIQGGVKEAKDDRLLRTVHVMNTIINGVKETKEMKHNRNRYHGHFILEDDIPTYIPMVQVQDVIENGVKHVEDGDWLDQDERITDIIENGVKEVKEISNFDLTSEIFKVNANRAIRDGVKELKELPDKSGEFRGYGDYYHRQEDITKPHTEYVKEVIEDSYNHMGRVEGVIRNTDKNGI